MKLGINTLFLLARPFEDGLRWAKGLGARCIEVACLGDDALRYCDIDKLLANEDELKRWLAVFEELELEISAFTAHGNGLSPDKVEAEGQSRKFRKICKLAQAAGADDLAVLKVALCPASVADSEIDQGRRRAFPTAAQIGVHAHLPAATADQGGRRAPQAEVRI